MKRLMVLFSVFLLGCTPDATEKVEKKEVALFFPAENIKLDFCARNLFDKDRKATWEITIVSPNEAHIKTSVFVPDLKEIFEDRPFALEEKDTLINRTKLKLEKGKLFYAYFDTDEEKGILLKEPVVVGNKWEIPHFFIDAQTGEKTALQSGICTIQALGKEIVLGKKRAVVTVGCLVEGELLLEGGKHKLNPIKTKHKMAENLGVIFESHEAEGGGGPFNIELCEDSCASCGEEKQESSDLKEDKSQ
jgi:hypothetical protein